MGNVPISCCKSKSPRIGYDGECGNSGANLEHDPRRKLSNRYRPSEHDLNDQNLQATHNLQHISEREPDDSDTDPSSNPYNRPIFATRSTSKSRSGNYTDSYSSTYSPNRYVTITPLTSSQDQGYNSGASTNLNSQQDGQINHSFETNISHHLQGERPRAITFELGNSSSYSNSLYHDDISNGACNRTDGDYLVSSTQSTIDQTLSPLRRLSLRRSGNPTSINKVSSCSTIFVNDSTISQPNLTQTIRCVSLAIYYHIRNRTSDSSIEIFDETIHPLRMPVPTTPHADDDDKILDLQKDDMPLISNEPDIWTIYKFVNTLFKAAQLTSEYAITTLVYLERLMTYTELDLAPKTWRRMFLGAILLSSKVWEDQAVWNVDYAQILEGISVEDINELERQFLELIQFNMNVPSSVYAKYYFHLRTLALKNGLGQEQTLLTICKAKDLEAMSRGFAIDWQSSPIQRKSSSNLKRHTSLEKTRLSGKTKAVLM